MRITSTYVEKTFNRTPLWSSTEDHLHIRGENRDAVEMIKTQEGSPPHTWRKRLETSVYFDNYRITSTYVEKTICFIILTTPSEDHLHIRGENSVLVLLAGTLVGSPPHTWRKRYTTDEISLIFRITSTYVEKTFLFCKFLARLQDHLHIRGENESSGVQYLGKSGSPPHTWRKRSTVPVSVAVVGITSTYVEKTNFQNGQGRTKSGSPPHTWRKLYRHLLTLYASRITSTYVEKTLRRFCLYALHEDHLHIRGENSANLLLLA